jgi:hypothetical protein
MSNLKLNTPQGAAPGGTVAFSNHDVVVFAGVRNRHGATNEFTGYQWQCVEFARRWLWDRKALLLPDVNIAAEIFYVPHVYDPVAKANFPVRCVENGTAEKPVADVLIIYRPHSGNFPGHVGVITEVGDDYVCVADQNRDFKPWAAGTSYMMRFPLKHADGLWTIVDEGLEDVEPVLGWVTFPGRANVANPEGLETKMAVGDDGKQHAQFLRDLPADHEGTADYDKATGKKKFWGAMFSFSPHWAYMPFTLVRMIGMMVYFTVYYKVRGLLGYSKHNPMNPNKEGESRKKA